MDTETKSETQDYIELDVLTGLYAGNTFLDRKSTRLNSSH